VGKAIPGRATKNAARKSLADSRHVNRTFVAEFEEPRSHFVSEFRRNPVAPLLEMKRHIELFALIQKTYDPIWVHGTRIAPTLAAGNDPINRVKFSAIEPGSQIELT
jgi:hypothetical protein